MHKNCFQPIKFPSENKFNMTTAQGERFLNNSMKANRGISTICAFEVVHISG